MAGFPIRKSPDHSLFIDSPRHIADYNVLHRFLVPRHPPCALKNLRSQLLDARVHCVILKQHATHNPTHPNPTQEAIDLVCGLVLTTTPEHDPCPENPTTRRTQPQHTHHHHAFPNQPHILTPSRDQDVYDWFVLADAGNHAGCTMIIVPPMSTPHTRTVWQGLDAP